MCKAALLCFASEDTEQRSAAAPTANEAIYKVVLLIATLPRGRVFGKLTPLGEDDRLLFVGVSKCMMREAACCHGNRPSIQHTPTDFN